MTASITLPSPTVSTPSSSYADEVGRRRKITFEVGKSQDAKGSHAQTVQISISHNKSRKEFVATVNRVLVVHEVGNPFTIERSHPMDASTLRREPVARFSKKAIEAFTQKVLAEFPDLVQSHLVLQEMFAAAESGSDL